MRSPTLVISDRLYGLHALDVSGEPIVSSRIQRAAGQLWLLAEESSGFILSELGVYALEVFIGALGAPSLLGLEESALLLRFVLIAALVATIVGVCYRLPLPLPVRLLLAGFLIGPYALGVIPEPELAHSLIEFGALLLIFVLGTSLRQRQLTQAQLYLPAALIHIGLTTLLITLLLAHHGTGWHEALFTGTLVAVSFTPVTAHFLTRDSDEFNLWPAAGNMLLIEGLIIAAVLLLIPPVSEASGLVEGVARIFQSVLLTGALVMIVFIFAQRAVPTLCERAQSDRECELTWMTLLPLSLGLIVAALLLELPLALGVLLSGIFLSRVRYRQTKLHNLHLLRWIAAASFFIPLGMIVDVRALLPLLPTILLIAVALFIASIVAGRLMSRLGGWTGPLDGSAFLLMGGVGELAFLLFYEGRRAGLSPGGWNEAGEMLFLGVGVVSVVLIPGLMKAVQFAERKLWPQRTSPSLRMKELANQIDAPRRVIAHLRMQQSRSDRTGTASLSTRVCGYGAEGPVLWTIPITSDMPAANVSLGELTRRSYRGLRVIALWHRGAYVSKPPPEHRLQPGDIVLVSDSRARRHRIAPYFQSSPHD